MATSRSAKRSYAGRSSRGRKSSAVKKVTPKYTAAQVRAAFPNAQAEILHEIADAEMNVLFTGTVDEIKSKLTKLAQSKGLKSNFTIERRKFTRGSGYYRTQRTSHTLVGFRPYTDAELEAEGPKLVKKENDRRLRIHKAELKKVQDFNKLATGLGQPLMNEPSKPELLKL